MSASPRSVAAPGIAPRARTLRLAVPVYDEGPRLAAFLADLAALAPASAAPITEIVVVDDGSGPEAARAQEEAVAAAARVLAEAGAPHSVSLVRSSTNVGKGAAIRMAWGPATTDWLGFVDGDGAVPAAEVWRLATRLGRAGPEPEFEALVSTRVRSAERRVRRTPLRALQGRIFARASRLLLALPPMSDPQCGLKFFRASRVAPLLPQLRERRWLLDLEVLGLLAREGASVAEEPIDWQESGRSNVVAGVDPARMLLGVLRLRARLAGGQRPR
jgi:dolichyl-phosphate beta-glucosyltransferase